MFELGLDFFEELKTSKMMKSLILKHSPYWLLNLARQVRGEFRIVGGRLFSLGVLKNEVNFLEAKKRGFIAESDENDSRNSSIVESVSPQKKAWANAFCAYREVGSPERNIDLLWADGPAPGNFGDWLSPYIINKLTGRGISLVDDYRAVAKKHLVAVGSLAPAISSSAFVLGAGAATRNSKIDPRAVYYSLRGPRTAKILQEAGGISVENFGDLGFMMSRVYMPKKIDIDAEIVLVRHVNHATIPMILPAGVKEISVAVASASDIERFIDTLYSAKRVVTSAMHCFIVCQSYSIPCALVNFDEMSSAVYGDGTKYADALEGVGLNERQPIKIPLKFDFRNLDTYIFPDQIGEGKILEIESHAKKSLLNYMEH